MDSPRPPCAVTGLASRLLRALGGEGERGSRCLASEAGMGSPAHHREHWGAEPILAPGLRS